MRAVLGLGAVLVLGASSTVAYWTDEATVTGGTFTTGTLNMQVGDPWVENDPSVFTTNFAMANMVPGSTKDAVLKVKNVGSVPFTFSVTASATNSGAGTDQLGSAVRVTTYPSSSDGACTGTAIQGPVAASSVGFSRPVVNADGTTELCFRASLPSDAHTGLQGATTVITFTLSALQAP